jgi:RNA polymerase sigma-70 factor (ECF subfamily)
MLQTSAASDPDQEPPFLTRLRSGCPIAFEELVRRHSGRMLAVATRYLGEGGDAQDAVQEAFIAAYRSIGSFAGEARISTWLHRIVINCALMRIRSRNRRPERSIEALLPEFDETGHRLDPGPSWAEPPDGALERRERATLVRRCIAELPVTYRTVLMIRDIDGLDTEEAAHLLGVTENAVKIRLHRARQALRSLLDPWFRGEAAA